MCGKVICYSVLVSYGAVQCSSEFALAASRISRGKPIHYVLYVAAAVIEMLYSISTAWLRYARSVATVWL